MTSIGKMIVIAGLALIVVGGVLWLLGKSGFRGLPGDIRYESDNVRFYFPIVTCLVLSILLTGLAWLVMFLRNWWQR